MPTYFSSFFNLFAAFNKLIFHQNGIKMDKDNYVYECKVQFLCAKLNRFSLLSLESTDEIEK